MNDEELMAKLRAEESLPESIASEVFWAGFSRDLASALDRAQPKRAHRQAWIAALAVAACLALVVGARVRHSAPSVAQPIESRTSVVDEDEETPGLVVEEMSDEEVQRVLVAFKRGG